MADAKKCDICSKYYDPSPSGYRIYILRQKNMEEPETFDLCPECVRRMWDWLLEQEKNNERDNK